MFLYCILYVIGVLAVAKPSKTTHLQTLPVTQAAETQSTLPTDADYQEKTNRHVITEHHQYLQQNKRQAHHRRRKHRRLKANRLSSARRYFEKQLLVRNRTLALLGMGMEKFLPNAVDLLDINPQELPGESPFQNWHNQKSNQTHHLEDNVLVQFHSKETSPSVMLKPTEEVDTHLKPEVAPTGKESGPGLEYQYDYEALKREVQDTRQGDLDPLQQNFGAALRKLLTIFSNYSSRNDLGKNPCEQWVECRAQLKEALMGVLPACPCEYPSSILYEDKVWDSRQSQYIHWRDASGERLDVYKPGAEYCIRSLLSQGTLSLAVQHCCYDRKRKLLTRGAGAGTPNLVSPEVSPRLHDRVDRLPWRLCKGDFTVYNLARPPDNTNNCTDNPADEEYLRQVQLSKYY